MEVAVVTETERYSFHVSLGGREKEREGFRPRCAGKFCAVSIPGLVFRTTPNQHDLVARVEKMVVPSMGGVDRSRQIHDCETLRECR